LKKQNAALFFMIFTCQSKKLKITKSMGSGRWRPVSRSDAMRWAAIQAQFALNRFFCREMDRAVQAIAHG
jgi:hypothetical protein